MNNKNYRQRILITGGAGFIGSAVIRMLLRTGAADVLNCDRFTYAAVPDALQDAASHPGYLLRRIDICDRRAVEAAFASFRPTGVMHLAAESHVDRSIEEPLEFVRTNVLGTAVLLDAACSYYRQLEPALQASFRFHLVSTDEVFGSLPADGAPFTEDSRYAPNSPYAASKAGADHLMRAWQRTFGLPGLVTHSSNTFGPWQFPDKFIPRMIIRALRGQSIPLYGSGGNVRDWLFVEDHADALWEVFCRGEVGRSYNIGGGCELPNYALAIKLCSTLDRLAPDSPFRPHQQLIRFVADRPGHDLRYALDSSRLTSELRWRPRHDFAGALEATVRWYINNRAWWEVILGSSYNGGRLGLPPELAAQ